MGKHFKPQMPRDTLTQVGDKFYFNQIELRGRVLELRGRIRGMRRRASMNVWLLACSNAKCSNLCEYASGYDAKGIDYTICAQCKAPKVGKTVRATFEGVTHSKTICAATMDTNSRKPKYYVACDKCAAQYPLRDFLGGSQRLLCGTCHRKSRMLFGVYVASASIWRMRDKIQGVIVRRGKTRDYVTWKVTCSNLGCTNTCELRKAVKAVCEQCRADARALGDYESLYRTHLRQDAARAERQPSWAPTQLTKAQFVAAMQDKTCVYCQKEVPRNTRNKHTTADGRRKTSCAYLDRIDSRKPYMVGNVVTCCLSCNVIKGAYLAQLEMTYISAMRRGDLAAAEATHKQMTKGYQFYVVQNFGHRRKSLTPPKP